LSSVQVQRPVAQYGRHEVHHAARQGLLHTKFRFLGITEMPLEFLDGPNRRHMDTHLEILSELMKVLQMAAKGA
jgi:hypothetical protein